MFEKFNPCFCKHHNDISYCCSDKCKKERCPTLSNIVYGYIINPSTKLFDVVKYGFVKCKAPHTKCSFRMCNRCSLCKNGRRNCN